MSTKALVDDSRVSRSSSFSRSRSGSESGNQSPTTKAKSGERVNIKTIIEYRKKFNRCAHRRKRDIIKLLNDCEILGSKGSVAKITFAFDKYECIELNFDCNSNIARKSFVEMHGLKSTHNLDGMGNSSADFFTNYNDTSNYYAWSSDRLYEWIEYKLKQCISNKEKQKHERTKKQMSKSGETNLHDIIDDPYSQDTYNTNFLTDEIEDQIDEFMAIFYGFDLDGTHLNDLRKNDKQLEHFRVDMKLPNHLKKYWGDFYNIVSLLKMDEHMNDNQHDVKHANEEMYGDGETNAKESGKTNPTNATILIASNSVSVDNNIMSDIKSTTDTQLQGIQENEEHHD